MADEGRAPLPPKGFIYHETRCGSTLVANMLATLAPSRVFSESKPPTQTIRECLTAGCDRHLLVKMFRSTMALMGRRRNGEQHEHLYFKFQNSKQEDEEEEAEDGDSDFYASVSWSGGISGGIESSDLPLYPAVYSSAALFEPSPWESAAFGADEGRRSLATKKTGQMLTMNMTMECANWLQAMCAFALAAEKETPSKALFVDYANLPDAVPEYVFPQHFGMEAEVAETVPDWKDRMFEAAGSYSKGIGKRPKEFTNDVKEKHKEASPLIVEASEKDGGLYEVYRSLEAMQSWRRPDSEEAHH
ncbi:unnamed protein product [Ectocarpus sp. 12 AP-2014]